MTRLLTKLVKNMAYKVMIMPPAKRRLDKYVYYTAEVLKNKPAARAILKDARDTNKRLSMAADTLQICGNPILGKYGYRKINFAKHRFVMIYRIVDKTVIVDGMFHELQDYEGNFTYELNLH